VENPDPSPSGATDSSHSFRRFICSCCGYTFDAPIACGDRFCQICQGPRRRRIISKLQAITKQCERKSGYAIKHVVFTIPNQHSVETGVRTLVNSFRRLRQQSFWRNRCTGGAYVLEVTGAPARWHVHLHVLCQSRYMGHEKLVRRWGKVSPGRIVWIKNIPLKTGIAYLTKYLAKSDVRPAYRLELNQGLANTRLFQCFGDWHDFDLKVIRILSQCPKCGETMWLPMDLLDYHSAQLHRYATTWNRRRGPPQTPDVDDYTPPEWIKTGVN
jgi:ribosomal protein S27AE